MAAIQTNEGKGEEGGTASKPNERQREGKGKNNTSQIYRKSLKGPKASKDIKGLYVEGKSCCRWEEPKGTGLLMIRPLPHKS